MPTRPLFCCDRSACVGKDGERDDWAACILAEMIGSDFGKTESRTSFMMYASLHVSRKNVMHMCHVKMKSHIKLFGNIRQTPGRHRTFFLDSLVLLFSVPNIPPNEETDSFSSS